MSAGGAVLIALAVGWVLGVFTLAAGLVARNLYWSWVAHGLLTWVMGDEPTPWYNRWWRL